ncbi:MAG: LPS export ABC transporter periplasmic protein LptC [Deltaproteobacteria bacterium RIFOXYD12_FULL_56_24]|nr:MAG: LPS export ABC transporter periplasmic protein LptC [Deltaproteobacteria bacterium RIFOXYD12_FULL_56_24]
MMTGYRNILWLLPVSLLLSWPVWGGAITRFLAPRGGLNANLVLSKAKSADAGFTMEGVLFSQLKNGAQDWQIEAKRLYTKEDQDLMQLEAVAAQLFKGAERKFLITAPKGEYNRKNKTIIMRNGVRVQAANGMVVQSDSLSYDEQTSMIATRAPVQITGKGMDIRGQGMDYDMRRDSYDVSGRVKVDIR